ncbi:hypothetical protein SAMN05519104_1095 [Rhizobiales bacterium GAS188]|nr:hypothetical protein SAMN05519104_1095 [Rhizobiales bacterium GAS188]
MIAADADWVPTQLRWTPAGALVDWCHLGELRFTAPFFEQTIGKAMAHPFNLLFGHSTPLATLEHEEFELRPAGLIFHMSRCGSTLVTQMLAALRRNVVLSEPGPLDQIVRAPSRQVGATADMLVHWLRAMTAAFGRRRYKEERDLFIKFEAWHVLLLPLIRRAFPDVPWVFLYRHPVEVMASLARLQSKQMFPGSIDPALIGLDLPRSAAMSADLYGAVLLEQICGAAIAHHGIIGGGLLLAYRELPEAALTRMLTHFGLRYGTDELSRMREAALRDAKRPDLRYADESEAKRRDASAEIRDLAATRLAPLYDRLEALRLAEMHGAGAARSPRSLRDAHKS